jgi:PAS domain S-box-containing protein
MDIEEKSEVESANEKSEGELERESDLREPRTAALDHNHNNLCATFFDDAPIALMQIDDNGMIVYANKAKMALLGFGTNDYSQRHFSQFYEDKNEAEQILAQLKAGKVIALPVVLVAHNGERRHAVIDGAIDSSFKCNEEGCRTRLFNLFCRDVTVDKLQQMQSQMQFDITKVLVGASTISGALEQICATLAAALSFDVAMAWKINEKANRMSRLVHVLLGGRDHDFVLSRSINVPLSVGVGYPATVWFAARGQLLQANNHGLCFGESSSRMARLYPTIVSFPICIGTRIWGVISLLSSRANRDELCFGTENLLSTLESIGFQIGHFVDRIEAYEAYLKSQERYYVAITGSNDGIWDWDLVSNEVFYSPRYKEQLGFEENELVNHFDTFRTLCHPDDFQNVMDRVQNHLETKERYEAEFRCRTKSGEYKWISARGQAIWNAQGNPIRMAGSHRDISELKEAEEARIEYEKRILASESMFRQLAENIREVFWIISAEDQSFIYASPAFEELWQNSCQSLYQDKNIFLDAIVEADRGRVLKALEDDIAEHGIDLEFRIHNKSETRWIWSRMFPVLDEEGKRDRIYGIAHDITEKKEVERRVSEFYSTVSHELRTPLTSIRAALGLIEAGLTGEIGAETCEYVVIARDNSDRLIRLINDILDIRKLEADKLELKTDILSARALVESTIDSLRAFSENYGVAIISNVENDWQIQGDHDRLVQVLTNLISNAIKYTPAGKYVSISVDESSDKTLMFKIVDQGPGFAEDNIEEIFGLFQQLSCIENEMNTGTGLGLAIAKALIEKMGGQIGADSIPGNGATFWFSLPVHLDKENRTNKIMSDENRANNNEEPEEEKEEDAASDAEPIILIMEDSDSIALILKTLLSKKGYQCQRAATLKQARDMSEKRKPDLVMADINLPDGNGLDFVNWLHERFPDEVTPVVVLSGAEANISRVNHPAQVDWIKKPFESAQILNLLKMRVGKAVQ